MYVFVLGVDHLVCLLFLLMAAYLSPPSFLPFVENKEICFVYSFIILTFFFMMRELNLFDWSRILSSMPRTLAE